MERIDSPGHASNRFTEGNPSTGTPATVIAADWLNQVQEEIVGIIEDEGLTPSSAENQLLTALGTKIGKNSGFANAIINGDFRVAQRGNTKAIGSATPEYVLDRWISHPGGGSGAATVTRVAMPENESTVPGNPEYLYRHDQTANATTTNPALKQRIEGANWAHGENVTLSFWAKVASGSLGITPRISQNFGSGGSSQVDTDGSLITVGTTWAKYTATVTLPSVTGKTFGSNDYLELNLILPTGDTYALDLANVQLVKGNNAPTFVPRPRSIEDQLCYRFFEKSYPHDVWNNPTSERRGAASGWGDGTDAFGLNTRFRVEKRIAPVMTWFDPEAAGADNVRWNGATVAVTSKLYADTVSTGVPRVGSSQTESLYYAHWEADAEFPAS